MRPKTLLAVLLVIACGAIGFLFGTGRLGGSTSGPVQTDGLTISRPVKKGNDVVLETERVEIPKEGDPIAATLIKLIETGNDSSKVSAMPKGVKLLSVKVDSGVAMVDLSKEFLNLGGMGDTGESLAQNALRQALAQFKEVEKVTVLVEGKTYEGEHSGEWKEIPVRDGADQKSEKP